jgi:hypothetical protein
MEVSASLMIQIVPKAHHNSSFLILHSSFPSCGEGIKNTHPLKDQGWDTKVFHGSTLVTAKAVTHWRFNGRTRQGISSLRLRSGILSGRGTDALHQNGNLSGNLSGKACLHHSFLRENFSTILLSCQSFGQKMPCRRVFLSVEIRFGT